jgi:hypothetical protein
VTFVRVSIPSTNLVRLLPMSQVYENVMLICSLERLMQPKTMQPKTHQDLLKEAKALLRSAKYLPHKHIRVKFEGDTLVLKGQVENHFQKRLASKVLENLTNSKQNRRLETEAIPLRNQLCINHSARAVETKTLRLADLSQKFGPSVLLKQDCQSVHLDGHISSWQERMEVEQALLSIPGISSVENSLVINDA